LPLERLAQIATDRLRESVLAAEAIAVDASRSIDDRTRATVIAANGEPPEIERLAREIIQPSQPQQLQSAGVWAVSGAKSAEAWKSLFVHWTGQTTSTRQVILEQSLRSPIGSDALVAALEADVLSAGELPASVRDRLNQLSDKSLLGRVQPILAAIAPADRGHVLARYADVAKHRGDPVRGAQVFKRSCQTCHAVQGVGKRVGPDLASISSRRSELLLVDILDPSRQVSPDFVSYIALTKGGQALSGLIIAETAESVTLRREEGEQQTIPRTEIEQLRASGKSMMPDGLEQSLTPEQLTDLLEFLHHPDAHLLN
jgi:putative heme-binding domain-containing protein